jgi:hypothetical protein
MISRSLTTRSVALPAISLATIRCLWARRWPSIKWTPGQAEVCDTSKRLGEPGAGSKQYWSQEPKQLGGAPKSLWPRGPVQYRHAHHRKIWSASGPRENEGPSQDRPQRSHAGRPASPRARSHGKSRMRSFADPSRGSAGHGSRIWPGPSLSARKDLPAPGTVFNAQIAGINCKRNCRSPLGKVKPSTNA